MQYVSFECFIQELKHGKSWTLEMASDGLILTVLKDGEVRRFHSPNPRENTDLDWGLFAGRIGHVIDMRGVTADLTHLTKLVTEEEAKRGARNV